MQLFMEVLVRLLERESISAAEAVEMECYKSLKRIKAVIENDGLSDFECVEEIVRILEEIGSGGGNRHDFG